MVVVDGDVDNVHVDGRHTFVVAVLLHEADDLVEVLLGRLLVTTVAVDVAQHVVGHVHLALELLLAELAGELSGQLVGLEDVLAVHLEDDLVAPLGVVAVQVVASEEIVLEPLQGRVELGAVAGVEGVVHVGAQPLVGGVVVVGRLGLCRHRCEHEQDDICQSLDMHRLVGC